MPREKGRSERDFGWPACRDVLLLVGIMIMDSEIKRWSQKDLNEASQWAGKKHFRLPHGPKPEILKNYKEVL